MMSIDAELVTRKMVLIAKDLDMLRTIFDKGLASYLQSAVDQAVAERYLERAVGRMIDINYHVITESGNAPSADYFASFTELGRLGILDAAFAQRIARAAGLRNRLVHEYDEIDSRRVFEALETGLRDIPGYLTAIRTHVA